MSVLTRDSSQDHFASSSTASTSESEWDPPTDETLYVDMIYPFRQDVRFNRHVDRDCSLREYETGKDMQAIDWESQPKSRGEMRAHRLNAYDNYLNLPGFVHENYHIIERHAGTVAKGNETYRFESFRRDPNHDIVHFQLRNLLWATSAFEFYYSSRGTIRRYNSLSGTSQEALSLHGRGRPITSTTRGNVMISTFCVAHDLLAVGGFYGELVVKRINGDLLHCQPLTSMDTGITNGLEIYDTPSGLQLIASNNDNLVRRMDVETFSLQKKHLVPWPANWASASPNGGKMLAVVGDNPVGLILDSSSGQQITELTGHLDFSFAAAWHPSGNHLATGNQDTTTRIWDIRMPRQALHVLVGEMAAVRSLRYSSDGRYLAAAEAADFVHIYDADLEYTAEQEIEMFSEICGIAFTPDDASFMISLQEEEWGGFLQHRIRNL